MVLRTGYTGVWPMTTVADISKAMLSYGLFKQFPVPRRKAAEVFVQRGWSEIDLSHLACQVRKLRPNSPSAVLASWLKDADGELEGRILELRAESQSRTMNDYRRAQIEDMSQADRRLNALRGIQALLTDDWRLDGAIQAMNDEFQISDPITSEEALDSDIVGAGVRRPSTDSKSAIQAMVERAREEATAGRAG